MSNDRDPAYTKEWHIYKGPVTDVRDVKRRCAFFAGGANTELYKEIGLLHEAFSSHKHC